MLQSKSRLGPQLFSDRTPLSCLPGEVVQELHARNLTSGGKQPKVSFVGILMLEARQYVFLPRSSLRAPNGDETAGADLGPAANVLKAVEKYAREGKSSEDHSDEGQEKSGIRQLSLIRSLLDDYKQHGIYTKRRTIRRLNAGKPDWKTTVSRITPYPNANGQPVYIDTYSIKRQYFNDCEIAAIHASVIRDLDAGFSWMVTGNLQPVAPELKDYPLPKGQSAYQVSRLQRELNQTYSDRDIRLLKHLIQYLKAEYGEEKAGFTAGLRQFQFCWEHMLDKVLDYTVNLNSLLPAPVYIDSHDVVHDAREKGMRTDTIMRYESAESKKYVIADAKYYDATSTTSAPGWSDIVKQFFYEKALATLEVNKPDIKNVFIFPGKERVFTQTRLKNKKKDTEETAGYTQGFEPIYCYYADPEDVVEHYIKGSIMKELTKELLK